MKESINQKPPHEREKKELTPEEKEKMIKEFQEKQKELQEKIERVGKEINDILEKEGLRLIVDHFIKILPK